ncbi:uncharacterized protein ARMOST_20374 [Armillaria ostoyae]|uniref:Uncharacterized protein n=1 Tax=Armillaria ostoyae TaxID=47428 RepID=A0A284S759_ARMOS|nr:uncharacterized protein ARMOST_20374 [Armillaria ostoyae]
MTLMSSLSPFLYLFAQYLM